MADFLKALAFTLTEEGGWCHVVGDSGGETYRGISRVNHPTWFGWLIIDSLRSAPDFPEDIHGMNQRFASSPELQDAVVKFYRTNFWSPLYAAIQDQAVATKVFDLGVNEGRKEITLIAQRALVDCGQDVIVDGAFGSATLKAINASNAERLLELIKFHANKFYDEIEVEHPSYKMKFDKSWRRRVDA